MRDGRGVSRRLSKARETMRNVNRLGGNRSNGRRAELARASQSKVSILIADDRLVVRSGLRALIQTRNDFEVCAEVSNGREAIDGAAQHRPSIAILDMMLPAVDGIKATREIRRITPATEVMIFTDRQSDDAFYSAILAGARGYVCKWETDERIVAAIETLAQHGEFYSSQPPGAPHQGVPSGEGTTDRTDALTPREREIVRLIAEGKTNKKIANLLRISAKTVETHRAAAMNRLGAHSTAQLVRYAIRCGLIQP
jgi:DNA-binding NarL/FixJ family response regulator